MITMAWVDTTLKERDFQNEFLALLQEHGWKLASHFKKVAFSDKWVNPIVPKLEISAIEFHMAEHFIYESAAGAKFGIAFYGMQSMKYGTLDEAVKPENAYDVKAVNMGAEYVANKLKLTPLGDWITNKFPPVKKTSTMYMYQIEGVDTTLATNEDVILMWDGDLKQAVLDVEVKKTKGYVAQGQWSLLVEEAFPEFMQSPISQANIRVPSLEERDPEYGDKGVLEYHNIWADSLIQISGQVEPDRLFVILQADPSSSFEENGVPSIPIFWGMINITKFKKDVATFAELPTEPEVDTTYRVLEDETRGGLITEYYYSGGRWNSLYGNEALFTGSATDTHDAAYDFDNPQPFRNSNAAIMPLLKKYTKTPGNGVDHVMMRRNKFGARYQAHYLSWNTAPNNMPPDRKSSDGRKYPRAWLSNKEVNDEYNYKFNTSQYTRKVHTSRIYIIHPDEGVRGWIPHAIGFNPLSLVAGDKLKVKTQSCPDVYDVYRFTLVEGISPLTKRPATAYRPMGIGIFESSETDESTIPDTQENPEGV